MGPEQPSERQYSSEDYGVCMIFISSLTILHKLKTQIKRTQYDKLYRSHISSLKRLHFLPLDVSRLKFFRSFVDKYYQGRIYVWASMKKATYSNQKIGIYLLFGRSLYKKARGIEWKWSHVVNFTFQWVILFFIW